MTFVSGAVSVQVPATSANLGSGFDSFGIALPLYDKITARVAGDAVHVTVSGEGVDELPTNEEHLIAATMLATFDLLKHRPQGLDLNCENSIPQARGMGSSSAAIVAGILLARNLVEDGSTRLDDADVIRLAAAKEGHPDNVAACVLGGCTIAWTDGTALSQGTAQAVSIDDAKGVLPIIFVPVQRGYTAQARAVLPPVVPLADAAYNAARTALLVRALTGSPDLLLDATDDRLHQQYRAADMPDTTDLVSALRARGIAAFVSGAGPSVCALVPDDQQLVATAQSHCPDGWWARLLPMATEGAQVL